MGVRESWRRIAKWAAANIPEGEFRLARGATKRQIADLEKILGFPLPEEVRESYRAHNGTDETPFPFQGNELASLDFIGKVHEMRRDWMLAPGNQVPGSIEGPIKPEWWSPRRVQLTESGAGDGLMIDLDPAEGGTVGQVIEFSHELGPLRIHAASWGRLLERIADDAEAGRYLYGKDDEMWGLVDDGSVGMAKGPTAILEAPRPPLGVTIDPSPATRAALAAHPEVEAQIRAWIDDPSPKLDGLRVSFVISPFSELLISVDLDNGSKPPILIGDTYKPKGRKTIARILDECHKAVVAKRKKGRSNKS
jgi:cell wall assembly regulator SMI1